MLSGKHFSVFKFHKFPSGEMIFSAISSRKKLLVSAPIFSVPKMKLVINICSFTSFASKVQWNPFFKPFLLVTENLMNCEKCPQ